MPQGQTPVAYGSPPPQSANAPAYGQQAYPPPSASAPYGQPAPAYGQPAPAYGQPAPAYGQPYGQTSYPPAFGQPAAKATNGEA